MSLYDSSDAEWLETVARQVPEEGRHHLKWSWDLWRNYVAPRLQKIAASLRAVDASKASWTPAPCTCDTAGRLRCQHSGPLHKPTASSMMPLNLGGLQQAQAQPQSSLAQAKTPCPCGFTCAVAEGRPMAPGCFCRAHRR